MIKGYANALLKDGKIMFWYTGRNSCKIPEDFYKDFYYAGLNMLLELQTGKYKLITEKIECLDHKSFSDAATQFYRQFKLHENYKGCKPY